MKPKKKTLFLSFSFALLSLSPAFANDYWVNGKTGKDLPTAGTRNAPWKTIAYALAHTPSPTNPRYHNAIRIIGGQTYKLTQPLQMKYNVRLAGDFVGTTIPVLQGPKSLSSLIHFPANVIFNRKTAGFEYLILEGGNYGVTMGGTGGKRHRPEILYSRFLRQGTAGILIRQVGTTICDPRFFDCRFSEEKFGIKAEASGANAVLRPDIDECRFTGLTIAGFELIDSSGGNADVGGLVRNSWFEKGGFGIFVRTSGNAVNTRLSIQGCSFRNCAGEGISILINQPRYDPQITIEDCSFSFCKQGVLIHGVFTPGVYSFSLRRNLASKNLGNGFALQVDRMGSGKVQLRYTSENNIATGNRGCGYCYSIRQEFDMVLDSDGDRAGSNGSFGLEVENKSSNASMRFRNGVISGGNWAGILIRPGLKAKVKFQFMTVADNAFNGLVASGLLPQSLLSFDHCVFAKNVRGDVVAPSGVPFTYCLFSRVKRPGTGNLKGTPKLSRPSYHLLPGSPCIDAGSVAVLAPTTDYEGDPRILAGKGNTKVPDLGADEFSPHGSAHGYGIDGFGQSGFRPSIGVAGSAQDVRIGRSLGITLLKAKDFANFRAASGLLVLGLGETGPGGLLDIGGLGAPGSFLWTNPLLVAPPVRPDSNGFAQINIPVPNSLGIVGVDLSAQWWVFKPHTNTGGFVTTKGLRIQIGK
jgi:hypothetical protein